MSVKMAKRREEENKPPTKEIFRKVFGRDSLHSNISLRTPMRYLKLKGSVFGGRYGNLARI